MALLSEHTKEASGQPCFERYLSPTANNLVSFLSGCCNLFIVYSKKNILRLQHSFGRENVIFFICKHTDHSMES